MLDYIIGGSLDLLHSAAHWTLFGAGQPLTDAVRMKVVVALQLYYQIRGFHVLKADRTFLPVEVHLLRKDLLDLRLRKPLVYLRPALST